MTKIAMATQTNMPPVPYVSVVIITRNRAQMLADCLAHLQRQTHADFEIVVVDSSSNDETAELMRSWPTASYVRIPGGRNNMPQARNVGIAHARGNILAFIDDDSMVTTDWLVHLIAAYDDPEVGGVGGRVLDPNRPAIPGESRVGAILDDGALVANFAIDTDEPRDVDWFVGCNMSFRRSAVSVSGGFDSGFTGDNSFEEVDHATRVRKAGYRLRFVPAAAVTHLSAPRSFDVATRDYESPRRRFYQTRNGTYFYLKNFGLRWVFVRSYVLERLWGLTAYALKHPSRLAWARWFATLAGYLMGNLAWIRHCAHRLKREGKPRSNDR
jgi:GT2 family glycosyltransferase